MTTGARQLPLFDCSFLIYEVYAECCCVYFARAFGKTNHYCKGINITCSENGGKSCIFALCMAVIHCFHSALK